MHISGRTAAVALPDGAFIVTNLDTSVTVRLEGPAAAIWGECTEKGSVDVPLEHREVAAVLLAHGLLVDSDSDSDTDTDADDTGADGRGHRGDADDQAGRPV